MIKSRHGPEGRLRIGAWLIALITFGVIAPTFYAGPAAATPMTSLAQAVPTTAPQLSAVATVVGPYDSGWSLTALGKTYKGKSKELTFQLAPGVNHTNIHNSGGKWQTLVSGLPACTKDGATAYQIDREAVDGPYRKWFNALVAQGGMKLGDANAARIELAYRIVMPAKCKPAPIVVPKETRDCVKGLLRRDIVIDWVWDKKKRDWVKAKPVPGQWKFVRELTPAEKAELNCSPPPPPPVQTSTKQFAEDDCIKGTRTGVQTTTTTPVWDEKTWTWVDGEPVVGEIVWTDWKPYTAAEKVQNKCIVTQTAVSTWHDCTYEYTQTTKTVTEVGKKPVVTKSTVKRKLTASEVARYCPAPPPKPKPVQHDYPTVAPHTGLEQSIFAQPSLPINIGFGALALVLALFAGYRFRAAEDNGR